MECSVKPEHSKGLRLRLAAILADWMSLGSTIVASDEQPNIDSIAKHGVRFTQSYSSRGQE